MCVCMCMCVRERERERGWGRECSSCRVCLPRTRQFGYLEGCLCHALLVRTVLALANPDPTDRVCTPCHAPFLPTQGNAFSLITSPTMQLNVEVDRLAGPNAWPHAGTWCASASSTVPAACRLAVLISRPWGQAAPTTHSSSSSSVFY